MSDGTTHRRPCPVCDKGSKDRALAVTEKPDGAEVSYCHRCGYTSVEGGEYRRPAPNPNVTPIYGLEDWVARLWAESEPITQHTIAFEYLRARCCAIPPIDSDLRYHSELKHPPSGKSGPALVALITDSLSNKPTSLHRTWIRRDGEKANVDPPRLLAKGHRKKRGVIRLWPDDAVTQALSIAEGIETALSIATYRAPVWSLIDAGNLAEFPVLNGIECLNVFADHDEHGKGLEAARECARQWRDAERETHVYLPPETGDWNDVARQHG